jgi:hypothetical protein
VCKSVSSTEQKFISFPDNRQYFQSVFGTLEASCLPDQIQGN